jgi:hypothetical protein
MIVLMHIYLYILTVFIHVVFFALLSLLEMAKRAARHGPGPVR